VVSVAVYDTGFGDGVDLSVETALDDGLLDTLLRASDWI
jgi:4'-phosphopantetheinyl transferase